MSASDRRGGLLFTDTGPTSPDASAIRQLRAEEFKEIWGVNLDLAPSRPQGQILDSEVAVIHDKNSQLMFVVNQFNPELAEGIYQDGLCKIYFVSRRPAQPTTVYCDCTGLAMVRIPAGSLVEDAAGVRYESREDAVIPADGTARNVMFICQTEGAVFCPEGSVNRIVTRVPGWDTVANPNAGITGSLEEGRKALERRRYDSVAKNAHGNVSAVWGAVANLDGVQSVRVAENVTNVPETIRGVLVHGHSMFISAAGGSDQEIARTIYQRKDGGCGMDGNTNVTIEIPTRNSITLQKKTITFNRPSTPRAAVKVNIGKTDATPGNAEELIREAILNNWNGLDENDDAEEIPRVEIGETLLASRFYCSVRRVGIRLFDLVRIRVGRVQENGSSIPWADSAGFTLDEYPTLDSANIHIVEGTDPEDAPGTEAQFHHLGSDGYVVLNPYVAAPVDNNGIFNLDDGSGYVEANESEGENGGN